MKPSGPAPRYSARRFWLDDVWCFDWEACRCFAVAREMSGMPGNPVSGPPRPVRAPRRSFDLLYRIWQGAPT
jgi:hypothetical protein